MDEDLYNYDLLYGGNGLASTAAPSYTGYQPSLTNRSSGVSLPNLGNLQAGGGNGAATTSGTPSWMAGAQAFGTLGLGLASFLDQRKTANLQRQALRQNLDVVREHQANRRALGESWNKAWGQ